MLERIDVSLVLNKLIGKKTLYSWDRQFIEHMNKIDDQFDPGHRLDHVLRVKKTALELANREMARIEIVLPSTILHDSLPMDKFSKGRQDASAISARNSIALLKEWEYPEELHEEIYHAILCHSYSSGIEPQTLEAKVVQDADRLDALGAIGIARSMAVGFSHGNPLYDLNAPFPETRKANDLLNILDHFYIKLFNLPKTFHTESARKLAQNRIEIMENYLRALANEIGVEYLSPQQYYQKEETLIRENCMQQKIELCAGTLGINSSETVSELIKAGYTTFDLATAYPGVDKILGEVLQDVNRQQIKVCLKINDDDLLKHNFSILSILVDVLDKLNTEYIDILMLHSPALLMHDRANEVLDELIALKKVGKIKELGVSNFTVSDLDRLGGYRRFIQYNQIEMSPYFTRSDVVDYCKSNSIQIMAYGSFGRGKVNILSNEVITAIASKHHSSPHQVILAWCIQQGIIPVVKSSSSGHMAANLDAYKLVLEPAEIQAISSLNKNFQTCSWQKFVKLPNIEKYTDVLTVTPISPHVRFSQFSPNSSPNLTDQYLAQTSIYQAKM